MADDDGGVPIDRDETPLTLFESAILETKRGVLPVDALARAYWDTEFAIPSMVPVTDSIRDMSPALFAVEEFTALVVFSHESRAAAFGRETGTPYLVLATGRILATVLDPSLGVIINPRSEGMFVILPPEALAEARRTFEG